LSQQEKTMRNLGMLLAVLVLAFPAAAEPMPTISVTGEGHVDLAPDMATLSLGVVTEAATANEALDRNSAQLAAVIARLGKMGIADRDVQTSGLSLGPRYDYNGSNGAPRLVGYTATNMVSVRVRALDSLGGVLDSVVADGANTLNGLGFGLQDPGPATDEARRRAVADARHRAELYAQAAGVTLGAVLSISEQGDGYRPMPMVQAEASFAKGADVPVSSGELNLSSTIAVVYEIAR